MSGKAYTVSEINRYISRVFSNDFALSDITLKGELSNLKYHPSGHIYFTLKDPLSQISGIMFAGDRGGLSFRLENGMQVLCTGRIGVYERGGSYQIYAKRISMDGIGELYIRFEQLKAELREMGLFDDMYKKPIPPYAMRVGIVTAETGAAVRDIIQIAKRRNPYVELFLYPALVQGDGAAASIVNGIERLDRMGLDVLIVGRGGGSIEDLWAFNEESVAMAIFNADTPVISAVGHETDVTIADFVADLRAPTPSAAAELAVFDYARFSEQIVSLKAALSATMMEKLSRERQRHSVLRLQLSKFNPLTVLMAERQHCVEMEGRLRRLWDAAMERAKKKAESYEEMKAMLEKKLLSCRHRLDILCERLEAASPLRKMSSGFGYVQDAGGRRISSISSVKEGDDVRTTLKDGYFLSRVSEVCPAEDGSV